VLLADVALPCCDPGRDGDDDGLMSDAIPRYRRMACTN